MRCDHCFYWRNLNRGNDLTMEEIVSLSRSLGRVENLSISGGEPFLREQFSDVCRQFIGQNATRQVYVPTNGYFTERTLDQIDRTLRSPELELLAVELSLDGMAEFHDEFRGVQGAFKKAMQTYDVLAEIQQDDPRLRIHAASTATNVNLDEIKRLTTYLFARCPEMDHHNLAIVRGDRKNPSLLTPEPRVYAGLYEYIRRLWAPRESGRYGAMVEPMLQWSKLQSLERRKQVAPCQAGRLSGVVYANGDVSVCELHEPLGNLREGSFADIWNSGQARILRRSIADKQCHCTTEVFLWPSIVYQPYYLVQAMIGARVWHRPRTLRTEERVDIMSDVPTGQSCVSASRRDRSSNASPEVQ
jgi:MoaA/NifB/PqqE/SkfB family radical SAM enzyme